MGDLQLLARARTIRKHQLEKKKAVVEYADLCLLGPTSILHETADTLRCLHVPRTQVPEKVRMSRGTFKVEG